MDEIIMHPEYVKLVQDVNEMRNEIAILYEERNDLVFHECPRLDTEYSLKIGHLEFAIFEKEYNLLRIKRKNEIIKEQIQEGKEFDEKAIDKQLNAEYKDYIKRVRNSRKELEKSIERTISVDINKYEEYEIRKIYRDIVKKLHPDLNEDISKKEETFFILATEAYEEYNLKKLREINQELEANIKKDSYIMGDVEYMIKAKMDYRRIRNILFDQIRNLKNEFPYSEKSLLADQKELKRIRKDLNENIRMYDWMYSDNKKCLDGLLKNPLNKTKK